MRSPQLLPGLLVVCLAAGVAAGLIAGALPAQETRRPNVLFVAIDDQNDWIGHLGGHPLVKTPHIDRLAKRGTAFTNAHCQAPLCNPSRTSLMTGLRPSTTGIYGLAPWFRDVEELAGRVTLPQYLRQNGYRTWSTGKIYHGGYGRKKTDREFDVLGPAASGRPFPKQKLVKTPFGNHRLVDWGTFPHKDEDKGDYKVASWAVQQLDAKPKEPFFLSVGFFLPHVPCYATQKWFDLYPDDDSVLPKVKPGDREDTPRYSWYLHWYLPEVRLDFLREQQQWRNLVRSYLACTSFVDAQVGRVLAALKRNGLEDNTIVVLWSDHGWHLGEKRITGKNTLWDDGTRVPLVFAGPGVAPGQVCAKPAELLDIYPTLNELCGLRARQDLEGRSLVPQLRDANAKRTFPAITTHNQGNHGVRSEHWRYIRYADGSEELYDMRKDPHEWTNLAGSGLHAEVLSAHRAFLPKVDRAPAPGSRHRILVRENGKVIWQGKEIPEGAAIPGLRSADPEPQLKRGEPGVRRKLSLPGLRIDLQQKCVDVESKVCLREGALELVACTKGSKEHESIFAIEATARHVHAALLMLGAESGNPALRVFDAKAKRWRDVPPRGGGVEVFVVTRDGAGKPVERPVADFVRRTDPALRGAAARLPARAFVFAGSRLAETAAGPRTYVCDVSGNAISLATFGDELLCLAGVHDEANAALAWEVDPAHLPAIGTKVTLRLRPRVAAPAKRKR